MIEMRNLTRVFNGLVAVDSLNLSVRKGSFFGFLGRNGAGKTTTLKILSTVLWPTDGGASLGGLDVVKDAVGVRRIIGVVGEGADTTRSSWTSVEYLEFFLRLHGVTRREARRVASEWLERLDLYEFRHRTIGDFSSGMRRRLELSRALAHQPEVLLLDEPTKELDIPGKREMWDFLKALVAEEGVTVFICSHEAAEIEALCEEIAVIRSGRLQYSGSVAGLPNFVYKVTGISHNAVAKALQDKLPMLSVSGGRTTAYLAPEEGLTVEELQGFLGSAGLVPREVEEVHSFDERILAFI